MFFDCINDGLWIMGYKNAKFTKISGGELTVIEYNNVTYANYIRVVSAEKNASNCFPLYLELTLFMSLMRKHTD